MIDYDAQIDQWEERNYRSQEWLRWLIRRVRYTHLGGGPFWVHSPQVGEHKAEVLIKLRLDFRDRLLQGWQSLLDGNFGFKDAPVWLHEWEWFPICEVHDARFENPLEIFLSEHDTVPIIGTGYGGLNEYDIERGVEAFFAREGVTIYPTWKDFPPELI